MTEPNFSLEESAALILGPGPDGEPLEPFKVKWLAKRLRGEASPVIPGYKAGRRWRMTESDIAAAIELLRPRTLPPVPAASSLTRTSRRRLAS